jgi:hypothetical protein
MLVQHALERNTQVLLFMSGEASQLMRRHAADVMARAGAGLGGWGQDRLERHTQVVLYMSHESTQHVI